MPAAWEPHPPPPPLPLSLRRRRHCHRRRHRLSLQPRGEAPARPLLPSGQSPGCRAPSGLPWPARISFPGAAHLLHHPRFPAPSFLVFPDCSSRFLSVAPSPFGRQPSPHLFLSSRALHPGWPVSPCPASSLVLSTLSSGSPRACIFILVRSLGFAYGEMSSHPSAASRTSSRLLFLSLLLAAPLGCPRGWEGRRGEFVGPSPASLPGLSSVSLPVATSRD